METYTVKDILAFKKSSDKSRILLGDLLRVVSNLETGMYEQPLTNLIKQKIANLDQDNFSIGLLCSNERSRQMILHWLFGETVAEVNGLSAGGDYLILGNSESTGFQLQTKIGNQKFSSFQELLKVLQNHSEKRSAVVGVPFKNRILSSINFLLQEKMETFALKPALTSFFINRCNMLILVFSVDEDISFFCDTVATFAPSFEVILYAMYHPEKKEINPSEIEKMLSQRFPFFRPNKYISIFHLFPETFPEIPEILSQQNNLFRQGLYLKRKLHETIATISLLYESLEKEKKEHLEKKTNLLRNISQTGSKERVDKIRDGVVKSKSLIQQTLQELEIKLKDIHAFRLKYTKTDIYDDDKGETPLVDRIVKIKIEDLNLIKVDSRTKKVTIQNSYVDEIRKLTGAQIVTWLKQDLDQLQSNIDYLKTELKKQSELYFDSEDKLEIPEFKYKIESPYRDNEMFFKYSASIPNFESFTSAFASARNSIMTITMLGTTLATIIGALAGDSSLRTVIPVIGGIALLIMLIFTKSRGPIEEANRLSEEIEKVRDVIANEALRVIGETLRTLMELINREIRDWSTKCQKSLDDIAKKTLEQIEKEGQETKIKIDKKIAASDQNIRSIESSLREFTRIQQELNKTNDSINQDFHKLLNGLL